MNSQSPKKIYFVASVETAVNAFLFNHLKHLSSDFDITVIVNTDDPDFLIRKGLNVKVIPLKITRDIKLISDFCCLFFLVFLFFKGRPAAVHSITPKVGLIAKAIEEIKTLFGQSLFNKENELDRKKLRDMIFSDKNLKIKLENILHPKILGEVKKKLSIFSDEPYVVIDIPLLFETNQYVPLISRSLVIDCELSDQIERVSKRDGMEIAMVQSIISQQVDRNTRIQRGDDVILNDGSIESLEDSIKKLHEKYLNLGAVK